MLILQFFMHITMINLHEWIETTRKVIVIGIELEVRGVKIKITFSQDEQRIHFWIQYKIIFEQRMIQKRHKRIVSTKRKQRTKKLNKAKTKVQKVKQR